MKHKYSRAFALPLVMISSVIMMMVLVSGLTAATSVSTSMRDQYYMELARQASQSGIAAATACLKTTSYVAPHWSNPLKPNTNCAGSEQVSCHLSTINTRCGVVESQTLRTTFSVAGVTTDAGQRYFVTTGTVSVVSKTNRSLKRIYTSQQRSLIRGTSVVLLP